jgi:hypothetical protein
VSVGGGQTIRVGGWRELHNKGTVVGRRAPIRSMRLFQILSRLRATRILNLLARIIREYSSRIMRAYQKALWLAVGDGSPQRRCTVTLHPSRGTRDGYPVRPPPGILPLQAGIACGQLSPDYSRVLRE